MLTSVDPVPAAQPLAPRVGFEPAAVVGCKVHKRAVCCAHSVQGSEDPPCVGAGVMTSLGHAHPCELTPTPDAPTLCSPTTQSISSTLSPYRP